MKLKYNILIIVVLYCLAACAPLQPDEYAGLGAGERIFLTAEKKFQEKFYRNALMLYNEYLTKYPDGPSAPQALMREGEIYRIRKDYPTARKVYQYLIDKYGENRLAPEAMVEILGTLYAEGSYTEVIRRAENFIQNAGSGVHSARMCVLTGNAFAATGAPAEAVYFYARANEQADYPGREYTVSRLKTTLKQLSVNDLMALMERVREENTRGLLLYQLGLKYVDEEQYENAIRTLNQFRTIYPAHEYAEQAGYLITEIKDHYAAAGFGKHSVGCLLPLSGSHKFYGERALRGVELALKQAGAGEDITLIVKDTGSDANQASKAVEELAQAGVSAIIGPIATSETAAAIAQSKGIPIITFTQKSGITAIGDFVFRNFLTPENQVEALIACAVEKLGITRFAILYPDEKYGETFMSLFQSAAGNHGGSVTVSVSYDVNQKDFSGSVRQLLQQRGDFDAVFIPDAPAKTEMIIPQMVYYGLSGVQLLGTNLWHSDKLVQKARKFVQEAVVPDVFFAESSLPSVSGFVGKFQENFGEKPGFIEALAYDTGMMLLDIFRRPDVRTPVHVRDAILNIRDFQGVTGLTSFDGNGEVHKKVFLLRVRGNGFEEMN